MEDFIDIRLDIFEYTGQRARVRKALTISALMQEIFKEFDDINADSPERYGLFMKGSERPLNIASSLAQLDIQPHDYLVFDYVKQNIRQMLKPSEFAYVREEAQGKSYEIQWQPAVIGRPSNEAEHNMVLAVNLQSVPNGRTISRRHAEITYSLGKYYLEPLAENNPTCVNGQEIPFNYKRELKNGDRIIIGKNQINLTFLTQTTRSPGGQTRPNVPAAGPSAQRDATPAPKPRPSEPVTPAAPPAPPVDATIRPDATLVGSDNLPAARLKVENSAAAQSTGKTLLITETPFQLGRAVPLLGETDVSRQHAEIRYDAAKMRYYIIDLNSTNGVQVNGMRIPASTPTELVPGSLIQLGAVLRLRFEV